MSLTKERGAEIRASVEATRHVMPSEAQEALADDHKENT